MLIIFVNNQIMEIDLIMYASLAILLIFHYIYILLAPRRYNLPPSPATAVPVVGHLHLLKEPLHRTFQRFSQISGPIFSLKLGLHRCVVVSSPELVEECFTKNDIALSNRPELLVDEYIGYNHQSVVGAPYGDYWRSLRRIAAQELLSPARLNNFVQIRKDEVDRLVLSLHSRGFCKVELRPKLSELTFNVMMRMISGKSGSYSINFTNVIKEVLEISQASNPQDLLPFLQWIDFGGFQKKLASLFNQIDTLLQGLIDEHRVEEQRNTMIGHLLSLQESQPQFCTDITIKALLMSLIFAGTDTSSLSVEWAMALLLNHPHVLEKARAELESKIGLHRLINEDDLPNLPYLRNIILETARLTPASPLLIPHKASEDCRVGEYDIPRATIVFINAWAIHRDPEVWEEPMSFKPERFEGGKQVEPHKLMIFGMGRRACPGSGLAQRVMGVVLGSLIQCFDWKRMSPEEIDLAEGKGLTMPKLVPLEVLCKSREIINNIFNK